MYGVSLCGGGFIRSAELQRAIAELPHAADSELWRRGFQLICDIEHLEARGMRYSNQDFDVLSSALNYLDAVAPDVSAKLRLSCKARGYLPWLRKVAHGLRQHGFTVRHCRRLIRAYWLSGWPEVRAVRIIAIDLGARI